MMQGGLSCKCGHPVIQLNGTKKKIKKRSSSLQFFDRREQRRGREMMEPTLGGLQPNL